MAKARSVDLTQGPMAGHFRTLAIPAALGMVFNTLYNMVDMFWAGRLSTDAVAGLSIGFMVLFVFIAFGFGLGSGVSALVGGALGEKNKGKACTLAGQALSFAAALSALLMVLCITLSPQLIALVSEPGAYRDAATRYLLILSLSIPGFVVSYACNGALQAQGDSVSLTRALFGAFILNIFLNPLFIFGIPGVWGGMGFDGLAASTVVSQTLVMLFMLSRLFASDVVEGIGAECFRPRAETFKALLEQMLPTSFSFQIMILAGFAVQFALKEFGSEAIAAYGLGLRIEQLVLLPIMGVATSLLPIAAQNFGAEEYDRVREATAFAVKIALVFMAILCPILWLGAYRAMSLFTDDAEVRRIGVTYLHVDAVLLPVYSLLFIINSLLQALRRPIFVLWISLYRQGFGVAFFVWLLLTYWQWDVLSVWIGIATSVVSGLILSVMLAAYVAQREIGGLWGRAAARA
ncbi:MAG: MATE family efflux transporter [Pseudomonadota bacterium]